MYDYARSCDSMLDLETFISVYKLNLPMILKIFQNKLNKLFHGSSQDELMVQKQGTPPIDQGDTPPSEKAPDASGERDPEEVETIEDEPSKPRQVRRLVLKEVSDFLKNNDFEDDAVAELILVGKICDRISRQYGLTREEQSTAKLLSKIRWDAFAAASSPARAEARAGKPILSNVNESYKYNAKYKGLYDMYSPEKTIKAKYKDLYDMYRPGKANKEIVNDAVGRSDGVWKSLDFEKDAEVIKVTTPLAGTSSVYSKHKCTGSAATRKIHPHFQSVVFKGSKAKEESNEKVISSKLSIRKAEQDPVLTGSHHGSDETLHQNFSSQEDCSKKKHVRKPLNSDGQDGSSETLNSTKLEDVKSDATHKETSENTSLKCKLKQFFSLFKKRKEWNCPATTTDKEPMRVIKGAVMFDFVAQISNELSVEEGETIWLLAHSAEGEWLVALNEFGQLGLVPATYVKVDEIFTGPEISTVFWLESVTEFSSQRWKKMVERCVETLKFGLDETVMLTISYDSEPETLRSAHENSVCDNSCPNTLPLFSNDNDRNKISCNRTDTSEVVCIDPNVGREENHHKMETTNASSRCAGMTEEREKESNQPLQREPNRCRTRDFWRRKWSLVISKTSRHKIVTRNSEDLENTAGSHTHKPLAPNVEPETFEQRHFIATDHPGRTRPKRDFKNYLRRLNLLRILGDKRSSTKDTLRGLDIPFEHAPEVTSEHFAKHEAQSGQGTEKTETKTRKLKTVWSTLRTRLKQVSTLCEGRVRITLGSSSKRNLVAEEKSRV